MKIDDLRIDGYGHFHDRVIGPFASPLTVLYGPNEAGKSTALDFIRAMLFGFPTQGKLDFHKPLAGGKHGGFATFQAEDGGRFVVERRPGVRGGTIRITTDAGKVFETDSALAKLLGHANEAMYENVFAFGLGELQEATSLNGPDVTGQIYNAGLGAANLHSVLGALTNSAEKLFKPGGSNQRHAEILNELEGIEAGLKVVQGDAAEYGRLTARLVTMAEESESSKGEAESLTKRVEELERLRQGWDEWVELVELRERRAKLPVFTSFPESAKVRLEASQKAIREAGEGELSAAADVESARVAAERPIPDEVLLTDEVAIEQLRGRRGSLDDSLRDLPKRQLEADSKRADLAAALSSLGSGWDVTRVAGFDLSVPLDGELERRRKQLEQAEREWRESRTKAEGSVEAARDGRAKARTARARLEQMPSPPRTAEQISARRAAIRETRTALDQLLLAQSNREDAEQRATEAAATAGVASGRTSSPWVLAIGAFVLAVVAIGTGAVLGGSAAVLGLMIGLPLLGIAGFGARAAWRTRVAGGSPVGQRAGVARAEAAEAARLASLLEAAGPLGTIPKHPRDLEAFEKELEDEKSQLDTWLATVDREREAGRDAETLESKAKESAGMVEERQATLSDLNANWRAWLAESGLPGTLEPATAEKMLTLIREAKSVMRETKDAEHRVGAIEEDILKYRTAVEALATKHGMPFGADPASAGLVADALCRRFDDAKLATAERKSAELRLARDQQQLELATKKLDSVRQDLAELLSAAGAADPEEFLKLDADHEEALKIDQQTRETEQVLVKLSGPGAQSTAFQERLASTTIGAIEADSASTKEQLDAAEAQRDELSRERGATDSRLKDLSGDDRGSELRAHRQVLIEQLQANARAWSELVIARHLLERARSKYEAERQPDVLKHAQGFFGAVTGGRYTKLISPMGTHTVTVIGADGGHKTPEQLSRGTREQLYLALRFGLIRQFADSAEPLPVIVDDILVNFDPERQQRAAEAFAKLSDTNQVLVFTCHPETVELFKSVDERTQVIHL